MSYILDLGSILSDKLYYLLKLYTNWYSILISKQLETIFVIAYSNLLLFS